MPRRSLLIPGLLAMPLPLLLPVSAAADTLFKMTRERTVERVFSITGCGATAAQTVVAPTRASRLTAVRPHAGRAIGSASEGEIFARITDVTLAREAGRAIARFTATGSDAACRPPGPDCAALGEGCALSGDSEPVPMTIRYSRPERVYVTGTGRGGSRAYKPRTLPFGMRSAITGLDWRAWGSARAVGRGRVEF